MSIVPFSKTAWRWMGRSALIAVAGLLALALWLAFAFLGSRPQTAGEVRVSGIAAQTLIVRETNGVPHIFAATLDDGAFALGYAHAQDRFFQMDLVRRSVQGRLAELAGPAAAPLDARARIKAFPAVIDAQTASLSPQARALLAAYAAGVNARLARGAPAPEYAVMLARPAQWRVEDSVAVAVAMTENLTVGAERDLAQFELARRLDPAQLGQFFPPYPDWAPRVAGAAAPGAETRALDRRSPGSNAWVLAGARTQTGKPILANDPHLDFTAPGPFYLAHIKTPFTDLVGATLPGAPLIVIGRNRRLAWSNTTNQVDSADIVAATQNDLAGARTRTERIGVRHWIWFRREVAIEARETARGPLLDARYFDLGGAASPMLLQSAAFDRDNRVIDALRVMNAAQTVDQFAAAAEGWTAPMTHMLIASTDGDIAFLSTGALPLRDKTGAWAGRAPQSENPAARNPAAGFIATANNPAAAQSGAPPMPGVYAPYRIARIEALLRAGASSTVSAGAAMQVNLRSPFAARLAPVLARAEVRTQAGASARALLAGWNGDMRPDRAEPLIFARWIEALSARLYRDELGGDLFAQYGGPRRTFLDAVLTAPDSAWCDDLTTPARESCDAIAGAALDEAMAALQRRYGPDTSRWRWDRAHVARFSHPVFTGAPLLGALFTVTIAIGGSGDTIAAADYVGGDFTARHGASLRAVFDLADLDRSRFMIAPGQSGHPLSPHFRDMARPWAAGDTFEIRTDFDAARAPPGAKTLTLTPN